MTAAGVIGKQTAAWIWDRETGQKLAGPLAHPSYITAARFSPDAQRVATACLDGLARVWSAEGGKPLIAPLRHQAAVTSVEFSPDGGLVVTAAEDGTLR